MCQSHLRMLVMLSRFPEGTSKWEEGGGGGRKGKQVGMEEKKGGRASGRREVKN